MNVSISLLFEIRESLVFFFSSTFHISPVNSCNVKKVIISRDTYLETGSNLIQDSLSQDLDSVFNSYKK